MEKARTALKDEIKKGDRKILGVFLGGDNTDFEYTEGDIQKVISGILDASESINLDILFTTSRRTNRNIENMVKQNLKNQPRCKFLVIANEKNNPYAVGGILAFSDIIVVSGESTSMVSEAVSSGKRTIAFKGRKKISKLTKHEVFLDRLLDAGYLEIAKPDNLKDVISNPSKIESPSKKSEDEDWIYRNMWRLGA